MASKMVQHETKKLAITHLPSNYLPSNYAWAGTGSQDSKRRYLSFAAGAQIEIVEEREAGGWWAVRSSPLPHILTRVRCVPNARSCLVGRGAWMGSAAGFLSRTARWLMCLLRQHHRRPSRWFRHRFPIHFNQRRRSPSLVRRPSVQEPLLDHTLSRFLLLKLCRCVPTASIPHRPSTSQLLCHCNNSLSASSSFPDLRAVRTPLQRGDLSLPRSD